MEKPRAPYCRIYVVRHAQSEGNVHGIIQGHADYPLTERGKDQATQLAQELKHISFAAAFSSDLVRAKHTAEVIASEHALAVKTTQLLRERSFGEYNGRTGTDFERELRELLDQHEQLTQEEKFSHRIKEDIESDSDISGRFITFLREAAVAYQGQSIVVVSHSTMIRILLHSLGFIPAAELPYFHIHNVGYIVIESDGVEFFVRETHGTTLDKS